MYFKFLTPEQTLLFLKQYINDKSANFSVEERGRLDYVNTDPRVQFV